MKKTLLTIFLLITSLGFSQTPAAGPTIPPARNTWDVLSQYGSAYTNQAGVYFDSFGGSNIVGDVTLADNSVVKKYLAHSYSGIAPNGANNLNVAAMTRLHMDVWSPNFVSFKVKLEGTNGSNRELEVPFTKAQGSWNSYDLDLSTYSSGAGGVTLANLKWIVPVTFNPNNTTLYITNVYFYRPATVQPPTFSTTFAVPAKNVGDADFVLTPPTSNSTGAFSYTSSNTNVATIVNGNQLHIVGGGTSTITVNQAANGPYGSGSAIATFVASYPVPGPSPTPPARNSGTVVSMYTGNPPVYANPVGYNMIRAPWTGGTSSDFNFPNGTNTCIKLDNLGYFGYVTSAEPVRFSVVGMTKLHVDIYLNTPLSNLFVFLLSNGDQIYNTGPLVAGWNSLDINLSNYPGADLSNIYGFKFEQNVGPVLQMYLDNIYFYVAGSQPTISNFTVPASVFGGANFTITPPTSNSAGAFSYTSSNSAVATIVNGNQIQLVGIGSSTITANQAANGIYDAGSITASLVVSAPPLATAAPTPPARNTFDVISLYSNAYVMQSAPVWANSSNTTDELLQGNDTKKMSDFLVEIINFASTNVSQMTTLHMDIYTTDCTGLNIWLLNNGDRNAQIFPTLNGWNSIDIPLSTYSNAGLIMTGISLLKFESLNGPGKTVYVDNIYFYRPATLQPPTVGTFSVPTKNVGDADFSITAPTSNNTSPFTYTSSNTAVATINGSAIHIVGGGTSVITASQVSNGTFGPGSTTATFVVNFAAPSASPIPPARDPSRVVSMFTGTPAVYANAINLVRSSWTAATTMTTVPNGTNTALKIDNLGYIGLVNQGDVNFSAAGMTNLHLDIYVNSPFANMFFWLLSNGDQRRDIQNLTAGWNSINIDLSEFPGANIADIYGLKFEQNTSSTIQIYLDNIYFSNDTYYADVDGDGYGDLSSPTSASTQPVGYVINSTDCDDTNTAVYRTGFFYVDADNDGYYNGNATTTSLCYGAATPNGYTATIIGTDCNDANFEINANHVEVMANGIDDNCDGISDEVAPTSALQPSQCSATLSNIATAIYANQVSGAQGYRFQVTNGASVRTYDSASSSFNLLNLTGGATYATTYTIKVAVKTNNFWRAYSSACAITTPAIPATTKVITAQCGITLNSLSNTIYCDQVTAANQYRFEVSDGTNPARTFETAVNRFSLTNLAGGGAYATTYSIKVALRFGTLWQDYGTSCNVTTPLTPGTSNITPSQCGITISNSWTTIYATQVSEATGYRFEVVNGATTRYFDTAVSRFNLRNLAGAPPAANTTYVIRVAILYNSIYQPFGSSCSISTASVISRNATNDVTGFSVKTYPNPYADNFQLNLNTSSEESVEFKVYDMLGRQIDARIYTVSELADQQFGNLYPSGVYNIVVTQGDHVKTLRVIKR